MICLEKFYEETGMSRTMLSRALDISVDTLKKYERSNTDRMRQTTINKIEEGVRKIMDVQIQVQPLWFGHGWIIDSMKKGDLDRIKIKGMNDPGKTIKRIAGLQ